MIWRGIILWLVIGAVCALEITSKSKTARDWRVILGIFAGAPLVLSLIIVIRLFRPSLQKRNPRRGS